MTLAQVRNELNQGARGRPRGRRVGRKAVKQVLADVAAGKWGFDDGETR